MDWTQTGVEQTDALFTKSNISGVFDTGILDVRQYSSYYLAARVLLSGAGTTYNLFILTLNWFYDPFGSDTVFTEHYGLFARSNTGAFITYGGKIEAEDQMHAPYVQVTLATPNGPDPVSDASLLFNGTTRLIATPSIREVGPLGTDIDSNDNWIIHPKNAGVRLLNQPAGLAVTIPGLMRYSAARWRFLTTGAASMFCQVPNSDGTVTQTFESSTAVGATTTTNPTPLYMPHFPTIWTFNNSSAGAEANQFSVISEETRAR